VICPDCLETHRLTRTCGECPVATAEGWARDALYIRERDELPPVEQWIVGFALLPEERVTDEMARWFRERTGTHPAAPPPEEAVAAYARHTAATEPPGSTGGHVGTPKTRCPIRVRVVQIQDLGVHPDYGQRFLCRMETADTKDEVVWFTGENLDLEEGQEVDVVARIEEHGVFNGKNQTRVTRLKRKDPT